MKILNKSISWGSICLAKFEGNIAIIDRYQFQMVETLFPWANFSMSYRDTGHCKGDMVIFERAEDCGYREEAEILDDHAT